MRRWWRVAAFVLAALIVMPHAAVAQQPFYTDDADVTGRHRFHIEVANEIDWLQTASYPNLRQNTANAKFAYGLVSNLEIGFDNQLIAISNAPVTVLPRLAFGYGDLDLSVKWNFLKEQPGFWHPALAGSFNLEVPTGDARKQLGSGLTDYYLNLIAQKSLNKTTKLRLNGGFVFAGNTLTGAIGVNARGTVFTGAASVVHDFTARLKLGGELTGAMTSNFNLGRGQLQVQFGGNYELKKDFTLDFGVIAGRFEASPRAGLQVGFSKNF